MNEVHAFALAWKSYMIRDFPSVMIGKITTQQGLRKFPFLMPELYVLATSRRLLARLQLLNSIVCGLQASVRTTSAIFCFLYDEIRRHNSTN